MFSNDNNNGQWHINSLDLTDKSKKVRASTIVMTSQNANYDRLLEKWTLIIC
jgi:hypothetical protein